LLCPLVWLFHLAVMSDGSGRSVRRHLAVAGGVAAIGLGMALLLWVRDYGWDGLFNYSRREFTMAERVMTQPRVIWLYLKLIVLPWPGWLNIDHGVAFSTGWFSPWTTLPAMIGVLGMIGLGVWCLRRHRLVGFSILWFFLCHVPESTVMPLELVFEHRNYMPMVGMALLVAWGLDRVRAPKAAWGMMAIVSAGYFAGTYVRNGVYRTEWALFEDAHEKSPHLARPTVFLAEQLKNEGKIDEALAMYEVALAAEPRHAIANHNLGTMLSARGQFGPAIERFHAALDTRPDYPSAHSNLASVLFRQRKFDEALTHYEKAVKLQPKFLDGHLGMALTLHRLNRLNEALASCEAALAIASDWATAHFDKGLILSQMGRMDEAIPSYQRAIEIHPAYVEAHANLGQLYAASGRFDEGLAEYRSALAIRPNHEISQFGLANTLAAARQYEAAIEAFGKLVALNPKHGVGHYRLGMLLASQGKTKSAIASLETALRLMPGEGEAYSMLIRLLTQAKRYDEAIEWANRHLEKEPAHRETLLALGEAILKAGRADAMLKRFEPMLAEPDPDGRMHALVGDGLMALGREREAVSVFRNGLQESAESPILAMSLARVLSMGDETELRDGAEAESLAKYAAEASGNRSAEVLAVLAAAHAEAGHFEQAVLQAKKAQGLAIENRDEKLAGEIARQLSRYQSGQTYLKPAAQPN
jgi:tetratricopeptide (TPR) repeat protein